MDVDQARELRALEDILSDPSVEPIKLSYGLLKFITENFCSEIGRGGFGVVYQGCWENGMVAVKKISNVHELSDKLFMAEINCLKSANHKNIVRFLGYCADTQEEVMLFNGKQVMAGKRNRLLCFEYVPGGNIRQYLQHGKPLGDDWLVRYNMIRGICQGLHYLHDKHINHLDLKPENVMLDANMEAKITDFGLSRCLDQGKSVIITQNILGTPRYIAPEIIDKGEISLRSDMYALGIIIIELLTGNNKIDLENWDESLDMDCPLVKKCTEIARNCSDPDKYNRPTIREVTSDLKELESMIPSSSINQVNRTAFSGTEQYDVYPLELRFPFVPNQEMWCNLSLINRQADGGLYCLIVPEVTNRFWVGFGGFLPPMSTAAISLRREAKEKLPSGIEKLEMLLLVTGPDEDVFEQQLSTLSLDKETSREDTFKAAHELLGFELHRVTLTAVVVIPKDNSQVVVEDTAGPYDINLAISSLDVHPTKPWVLIDGYGRFLHIFNWQTKEVIGNYRRIHKPAGNNNVISEHSVAKLIPREQWVVIGDLYGSICVWTCPTMDHQVKEIKAHSHRVTSLAVHPTRPLLLSCSNRSFSLKLWDWNCGWACIAIFDITSYVRQVMFDPKHASTFATLDMEGIIKKWRIGYVGPIAAAERLRRYGSSDLFTFTGYRNFVAAMSYQNACIWDLEKKKHVHTLFITESNEKIVAVICHPTRPVLVTASGDGSIRVWDSTTYRLKKTYLKGPKDPNYIGFTGSRRLVIAYTKGISVLDIDLE